jgi:recombinational DNA repair ATPase RecF
MSEEYQGGKWNMQKVKKKGFRSGAVMRVNMHNFLTFDDCEVFPGPRLNVILGPNGTGKSTITHAICLACCGKPETVG